MAGEAAKRYTREIRKQTGYEATWLPIVRIAPGDVGTLRHYEYRHVGTLTDFGIQYETEESNVQSTFDYVSRGAVSKSVRAASATPGAAPTAAEASLEITFGRADAIVFSAVGCRSARLSPQQEIGERVLSIYKNGLWPRDYVVVTEAIIASSATILMSSSAEASVELAARADVNVSHVTLADTSLGLRAITEKQMGLTIIAERKLTPLFRAAGIRRSLLGRTLFRGLAADGRPRLIDRDVLAERSYEDFA